jgi:hypothetical protein
MLLVEYWLHTTVFIVKLVVRCFDVTLRFFPQTCRSRQFQLTLPGITYNSVTSRYV